MSREDRGAVLWRVAVVVVVIANTVVMWSDAVAAWWSAQVAPDDEAESFLPGPLRALLEARPDLGDAELHALVWSVPAFVMVLAVSGSGSRRHPSTRCVAAAVAGVWAWSVAVEALQPVVSDTRAFDWLDVGGNTVGVVAGAAIAWWWQSRPGRRHHHVPGPPGTIAPGGVDDDAPRSTTRDR